jgi:hypothetical protein
MRRHFHCKAWNLLKKMGTDAPKIVPPKTVTANNNASRLLCVSKAPMDMLVYRNHQYVD